MRMPARVAVALAVLLLALGGCSSEPDDSLAGKSVLLGCQVNPDCPPEDRALADAYDRHCFEVTEVEGKRVLIDHCRNGLARYAGVVRGTPVYTWEDREGLSGPEQAALVQAEDREFHAPSGKQTAEASGDRAASIRRTAGVGSAPRPRP